MSGCLREAAGYCDFLAVGLNSDASVKRLKGPSRPINPAEARAEVLSALEAVDAVTIFDEDTPLELINAICPDVLIKGGDYRPDEVVGRDEVEAAGGRLGDRPLVRRATRPPAWSTAPPTAKPRLITAPSFRPRATPERPPEPPPQCQPKPAVPAAEGGGTPSPIKVLPVPPWSATMSDHAAETFTFALIRHPRRGRPAFRSFAHHDGLV